MRYLGHWSKVAWVDVAPFPESAHGKNDAANIRTQRTIGSSSNHHSETWALTLYRAFLAREAKRMPNTFA